MRREPTFDDLDFDDAPESELGNPGPRSLDGTRLMVRLGLAATAIAGLTLFARERIVPDTTSRGWTEPQRALSAPSARAAMPASTAGPLLTMDASGQSAKAAPPRWNAATGLREDSLTQGGFDAIEAPFLRLTMTETAPSIEAPGSLFVTLARRAAELESLSVLRTGMRGTIDTKFGTFETVEATLGGHGSRLCTGFTSIGAKAMRIDGWLCGILGQAPEPQAVACAIDSVRLAIATTPTIEVAFGEAELRRSAGCASAQAASTNARSTEETGSITGRKTATGDRNARRTRKNEAELRRTTEARL